MTTRRNFLKTAVGVCAGTAGLQALGHLTLAQTTSPGTSPDYDCIIIGGGVAGLAAAYRLYKAGRNRLLVLEKHLSAGGICWAKMEHGYRFPMGTTYVSDPDNGMAAITIYDSLPEKWYQPYPEPEDSFYRNGQIAAGAWIFSNWEKNSGHHQFTKHRLRMVNRMVSPRLPQLRAAELKTHVRAGLGEQKMAALESGKCGQSGGRPGSKKSKGNKDGKAGGPRPGGETQ